LWASASETSTARKVGSPRKRAVVVMASVVILLSSGPTVMKASIEGSFTISVICEVENCEIATLSGLRPDSLKITLSSVTLTAVRPSTPTRCPSRSAISLIFDLASFLPPLFFGAPEGAHSTTTFLRRIATDPVPLGMSSSVRPTARSVSPALRSPRLSTAPAVVTTVSRTGLPSVMNVCARAWISF
jgi:hypothetical protein